MNYSTLVRQVSVSLFTIGVILILLPKDLFPDFYQKYFMGLMTIVSSLIIYLPQKLLKPDNKEKKKKVLRFQGALAISLVINSLGELGLYKLYEFAGFQYDKLAHFLTSAVLTIGIYGLFSAYTKFSYKKSTLLTLLVIFVGGIFWEMLEAVSDFIFQTRIWGYYGQYLSEDTFWDMLANLLGAATGIIILHSRHKKSTLSAQEK